MTQTADLIHKMAEFFKSEEFFEKGEDARLELSPDDVRCMNEIIKACGNGVSRQAVLELVADYDLSMGQVVKGIHSLPSVKPQESYDVPDTNVGDIISKQTVLDTISELNAISFYEAQEDSKECYYEIRQAIEDLSPVKQEPKTGHWIEQIDHEENCRTLICSNCDRPALHDGDSIWKHKFCPHCGAMMVEPQESEE